MTGLQADLDRLEAKFLASRRVRNGLPTSTYVVLARRLYAAVVTHR
jgi:hypothetical protein